MGKLSRDFFEQDVRVVAEELLGKMIVRDLPEGRLQGVIVETEAYGGEEDKASHARFGKTKRSSVMYERAGLVYVYLIYGMYWMLNFVTGKKREPQAVLVRGVQLIEEGWGLKGKGDETEVRIPDLVRNGNTLGVELLSGPGKVGRALKLDKSFYGEDLEDSKRIWLEDPGHTIEESRIKKTPRIGVDYAGEWAKKKWRYVLE